MWELSSEKGKQSRAAGVLLELGSGAQRMGAASCAEQSHSQGPAVPTTLQSEWAFPDRAYRSLVNAQEICSYVHWRSPTLPP